MSSPFYLDHRLLLNKVQRRFGNAEVTEYVPPPKLLLELCFTPSVIFFRDPFLYCILQSRESCEERGGGKRKLRLNVPLITLHIVIVCYFDFPRVRDLKYVRENLVNSKKSVYLNIIIKKNFNYVGNG